MLINSLHWPHDRNTLEFKKITWNNVLAPVLRNMLTGHKNKIHQEMRKTFNSLYFLLDNVYFPRCSALALFSSCILLSEEDQLYVFFQDMLTADEVEAMLHMSPTCRRHVFLTRHFCQIGADTSFVGDICGVSHQSHWRVTCRERLSVAPLGIVLTAHE